MASVIIDRQGNERRCGSLPLPEGTVCRLPPYGADPGQVIFDDATVKSLVTDKSRVPSRELFHKWVLNQLKKGSCNGHALAGAGARARFRRGVRDGLQFSGAYSYSKMNNGRDNGSVILDDIEVCQRFGFCPADVVTANMIYPSLQPKNADALASVHRGLAPYRLTGLPALRAALARGYGCIVAVMAGDNFLSVDRQGVCGFDPGPGNHAVLVQDLLWDGRMWKYDMVNSWGLEYGQDGCGYLTDVHFRQTLGPHQFVAIPSFDELSE